MKRLNKTSIEEYLPEVLYIRAGIDKVQLLGDIQRAKDRGDKKKERELKEEASNKIAQVIDLQDLDTIPIIKSTVQKALNLA